ncbi:MAG: domain S-box protein [Ferruginibacter sp.]|uniref:PAS domain S-box protein n=1 Tax=Ferruginibacter sp. TaxID=1940288 RepID=UPI00265B6A8A|nr:PAS domain S-box protein [Ferruginibacter sp.]MDB5278400.1 domain S-box protein [Ferruginibacter sp.]
MHTTLKAKIKKPHRISTHNIGVASIDDLHRLAFENSSQANIITNLGNGLIVSANNAACNLLGYPNDELLTKKGSAIFDTSQQSFKAMLHQRMPSGHSVAQMPVFKNGGTTFFAEITAAIFKDHDGVKKAVITIADLSESISKQKVIDKKNKKVVDNDIVIAQAKSDSRLAANNEWRKYIAKASYDIMWDWNIGTGSIYVGDSIEEIFGYKVKNNTIHFKDFVRCLIAEEKDTVQKKLLKKIATVNKTWKDTFRFKCGNGTIANTTSRASIVRDKDGNAIRLIGATQDVSRLQQLEQMMRGILQDPAQTDTNNKHDSNGVNSDSDNTVASRFPHNLSVHTTGVNAPLSINGAALKTRPELNSAMYNKSQLINIIKELIIELVHHYEEQLTTNLSDYLSAKLDYDYTYLSNLFSEEEDISIQQFMISQKIERVKKLLLNEGLSLTEIAWKLHYSSVAHLSNQFKKVTGYTPSYFKKTKEQ